MAVFVTVCGCVVCVDNVVAKNKEKQQHGGVVIAEVTSCLL